MKRFHPKVLGSFVICCLLMMAVSQAQTPRQTRIRGTVRAQSDGSPIAGATITLQSNKRVATSTDAAGSFALDLPGTDGTLEITSIGYEKKDIVIQPGQTQISIILENSKASLNEVVVTALGITRQKRSLGYAVTEVKGDEFTQARENNVANALSGKVAGVNAAGLSTGPGGSSRVIIRGNGSFGDNQPLYVINGMPMDNSVPGGAPTVNGSTTNVDRGDGIGGINPDDIESISVLKGGTAAALYGSRAANGVILITTKKGSARKGIGVEYSSNTTLDNVAVIPDFQYEYGQGLDGVKPKTLNDAIASGRKSWGAKIDGSTDYMGVDGKTHPYVAQKKNLQNYYQTGKTFTNSLAFSGGNESVVYRFSAAQLNSKGILPNTTFDRKTFNMSISGKLSDQLSIDALAQYNVETGHNRTGAGDALANPNWTPLEIANTADVRWLKPGFDSLGNETPWNDAPIASNGYFVQNKFRENDSKNRFIGQASITYKPIESLSFKATVSRDQYNYNYTNIMPTGTLYVFNGQYAGIKSDLAETNIQVIGTYTSQIGKDFGISVLGGVNRRRYNDNGLTLTGANFNIPYFYSFSNLASQTTTPTLNRLETNSVFGGVDLDFKKLFFLSFTGRQDWFSTLSPQHTHIFYPSVGGSFILSDAVRLPSVLNYAKLRASWAGTGGGAPTPYLINPTYSSVPSSGQPLQNVSPDINANNFVANANLRPYTSSVIEGGFELQMLNNRFGIDATYYDRRTSDEILNVAVSTTSGYSSATLNIGELRNKGVELLLTGKPVRTTNFGWTVTYNVAYNNNKVLKLAPGLPTIQVAATVNSWAFLNNTVGQPFGTIVGTKMLKDTKGNIIFNRNSHVPVVDPVLHNLGNSVAPWTMGLTNEFRYKRLSFSFLLDGKFGNKIFSLFEVYAVRMGKVKSTLPGRDGGLRLQGVDQTGGVYDTTITQTGGVLRNYYDNYKVYSEKFLYDGSFIKLRQVIFSYNIPVASLKFVRLQAASLSFVARNLFIVYKQTKDFDPEQSFTNSNNQGFESIGLPRTRSYGLNLSVKF